MIFPHLMLSAYSQLCLLSTSSSFLYVFWLLITRPVNQPALYCELGLLRETWIGSVTIIPVGQSSCEAPIKGSWACYRWVTSIQPPVMSGEITEVNKGHVALGRNPLEKVGWLKNQKRVHFKSNRVTKFGMQESSLFSPVK